MRMVILAVGTIVVAAGAQAQSRCDELWFARNTIFKEGGYCFQTPRAIRAFGNAGCMYDDIQDVPLSERDRRTVEAIQQDERRMRCPR